MSLIPRTVARKRKRSDEADASTKSPSGTAPLASKRNDDRLGVCDGVPSAATQDEEAAVLANQIAMYVGDVAYDVLATPSNLCRRVAEGQCEYRKTAVAAASVFTKPAEGRNTVALLTDVLHELSQIWPTLPNPPASLIIRRLKLDNPEGIECRIALSNGLADGGYEIRWRRKAETMTEGIHPAVLIVSLMRAGVRFRFR
jgi:hypothetical protein